MEAAMAVIATGAEIDHESCLVEGTWKFHSTDMEDGSRNPFPCRVLYDDLVNTAIALVNENLGGGEFRRVSVLGTANGELGIHFLYRMSRAESRRTHAMVKYEDWLKRRLGAAYKGHTIGRNPTVITLEWRDESGVA
jgi:hypothetical protein